MTKSWEEVYQRPADEYEIRACGSFHRPLVEVIGEGMAAGKKGKKLLEVGPGSGAFTVFFGEQFPIVSVDIDPHVVAQTKALVRERKLKNVVVEEADGFELPFVDGEFAVAFSQGLLEHFSDEEILALIAEQRRVADLVVFSVPSDTWVNPPLRDDERQMSVEEWERIFAPLAGEGLRLFSYWNGWMILGSVPGLPVPKKKKMTRGERREDVGIAGNRD